MDLEAVPEVVADMLAWPHSGFAQRGRAVERTIARL